MPMKDIYSRSAPKVVAPTVNPKPVSGNMRIAVAKSSTAAQRAARLYDAGAMHLHAPDAGTKSPPGRQVKQVSVEKGIPISRSVVKTPPVQFHDFKIPMGITVSGSRMQGFKKLLSNAAAMGA